MSDWFKRKPITFASDAQNFAGQGFSNETPQSNWNAFNRFYLLLHVCYTVGVIERFLRVISTQIELKGPLSKNDKAAVRLKLEVLFCKLEKRSLASELF